MTHRTVTQRAKTCRPLFRAFLLALLAGSLAGTCAGHPAATWAADFSPLQGEPIAPYGNRIIEGVMVHTFGASATARGADEAPLVWEGGDLPHPGGFVVHTEALTEPVTITTRFTLTTGDGSGGFAASRQESSHVLWLAGFSPAPDEAPTVLALTLRLSTGGFFGPSATLFLESSEGLLPPALVRRRHGAPPHVAKDTEAYPLPIGPNLRLGSTYDVALAYDPSTGLTSISVGEAGAAARFETHLYLNPGKDAPLCRRRRRPQ